MDEQVMTTAQPVDIHAEQSPAQTCAAAQARADLLAALILVAHSSLVCGAGRVSLSAGCREGAQSLPGLAIGSVRKGA
jgi:hypothetical protein